MDRCCFTSKNGCIRLVECHFSSARPPSAVAAGVERGPAVTCSASRFHKLIPRIIPLSKYDVQSFEQPTLLWIRMTNPLCLPANQIDGRICSLGISCGGRLAGHHAEADPLHKPGPILRPDLFVEGLPEGGRHHSRPDCEIQEVQRERLARSRLRDRSPHLVSEG